MARIRTIKPEFFTDEKVGECSPSARLLFIATWVFADDEGNLDRSAKQLKAQAFPYDSLDCEPLIRELIDVGLLVEYEVDGRKFLHIKNFRVHQKIDKPSKARVPLYEPSANARRTLGEDSESPRSGRERKGREGKGKDQGREQISVERKRSTASERERSESIERIFRHWQQVHHHPHAKLDEKRRKVIRRALELGYSEADLCQAISGYRNSPHHMGQNETGTVYDSIELMLRDAKHIDAGLKFYAEPPRSDLSALTRRNGTSYAEVMAALDAAVDPHSEDFQP